MIAPVWQLRFTKCSIAYWQGQTCETAVSRLEIPKTMSNNKRVRPDCRHLSFKIWVKQLATLSLSFHERFATLIPHSWNCEQHKSVPVPFFILLSTPLASFFQYSIPYFPILGPITAISAYTYGIKLTFVSFSFFYFLGAFPFNCSNLKSIPVQQCFLILMPDCQFLGQRAP